MKKVIGIIDGTGVQYDYNTKVLGGSETWTVQLSIALSNHGFHVEVFTNTPTLESKELPWDVTWNSISILFRKCEYIKFDYIIISRCYDNILPQLFTLDCCENFYIQAHDLFLYSFSGNGIRYPMYYKDDILRNPKIKGITALTEFHKGTLNGHNGIPFDKMYIASDGLDLELFKDVKYNNVRLNNRILFSSRPERGYEPLIELIKEIRRHPGFKDFGADLASYGDVDEFMDRFPKEWIEDGTIKFIGHLNKKELYNEMQRYKVWWYPAIYAETFNITCLENIMCGCMPVLPLKHGMADTLKPFSFIGMEHGYRDYYDNQDISNQAGVEEAAKMIITDIICYDDPLRVKLRTAMRDHVKNNFSWDSVVNQWINIFNSTAK
jgi:glycosyltransferase involved in cell wall biosynthesis